MGIWVEMCFLYLRALLQVLLNVLVSGVAVSLLATSHGGRPVDITSTLFS